jgi:hypothetical protein
LPLRAAIRGDRGDAGRRIGGPAGRLPRFIDIDGRRYLCRDLVALRQAEAQPRAEKPALFELREDHRLPGERNAAKRYSEPSLFTAMETPPTR